MSNQPEPKALIYFITVLAMIFVFAMLVLVVFLVLAPRVVPFFVETENPTSTPSQTAVSILNTPAKIENVQPSPTLTPTSTLTPTPTFTPVPPILVGGVINPETASKVRLQARWGRGTLEQVAWSSTTANVLAAASSLGIYLYEAETSKNAEPLDEIKYIETQKWVNSVAFSPDGSLLAAGLADGTIQIYSSPGWQLVGSLNEHQGSVLCVAFAPDGQSLASGSTDGRLLLWRTRGEQSWSAQEIAGAVGEVNSLAFSPDGTWLAFGSTSRRVYLWKTTGGIPITLGTHNATILVVAFSAGGDFLASGSSDGILKTWDVTKRGESGYLKLDSAVTSVAYSPEGLFLVIGTQNGTTELYDTSNKFLHTLQTYSADIYGRQAIVSIVFRNRGNYLIAAAQDGLIRKFVITDKPQLLTSTREDQRHSSPIYSLAYSLDGGMIATGSLDGIIRLHNTLDGSLLNMLRDQEGAVLSLAFSPDSKFLVSGSQNGSAALWLLSAQTLARNPEIQTETPPRPVSSLAFSPGGQFLASGLLGGKVGIWDMKNSKLLETFPTNKVKSIAFSTDGTLLASGSLLGEVRLWKVATRGSLRQLDKGHVNKPVNSLAFSPDGKLLASASDDRTVRVWEMTGFTSEHIFGDYTLPVCSLAFSPDSRILATGSQDGTIYLWQLEGKYELLLTLSGHTGKVTGLAFSPDGKLLASASEDGTVRIWGVSAP